MTHSGTILVGTVGQGIMRSTDYGESWARLGVGTGLHPDPIVRCVTPHPALSKTVFCGTDRGLYRSDDGGRTWRHLDAAMGDRAVWAVTIDEANPDAMIAGTGTPDPSALYRSTDGGETWHMARAQIAETCPAVGVPRPTAIALDPADRASVWAGLEVDGVRHSNDGGETWETAAPEIKNPDVHNILVTGGKQPRVFILVNNDVWVSEDGGADWRNLDVRQTFPVGYPRGVAARPDDPSVVFLTLGDTTPGRTGVIMRSEDAGGTWASMPLSQPPNSAMWTLAVSKAEPDLMFAATRYGYLYRSEDGGEHWEKMWRELSEVSQLVWLPDAD